MKALVSIHDVMPHTMTEVAELISLCRRYGVEKLTLLIVPGHDWSQQHLNRVRQWQREGCEIAAHGWVHRCLKISTLGHHIHSWVLSRDVAEHLSLSSDQIAALMARSKDWFEANDFQTPELYVPPAWAMGKISTEALANSGFRMVETLRGVRFPESENCKCLPLVGFEADTGLREAALRLLNRVAISTTKGEPMRVSIHPFDHQLRLRKNLEDVLRNCGETLSYTSLIKNG